VWGIQWAVKEKEDNRRNDNGNKKRNDREGNGNSN